MEDKQPKPMFILWIALVIASVALATMMFSSCTLVSQNRTFPALKPYWSQEAQRQREALKHEGIDDRQRVLARHPEARIEWGHTSYGWSGWAVKVKPSCGAGAHNWREIGADETSKNTAWFTALEWLLAYDYCDQ
jgi:hypothetical protein